MVRQKRQRAATEGGCSASVTSAGAALPLEVCAVVLKSLDHDSLFLAARVCKLWHTASLDEEVWEAHCRRRGWLAPRPEPAGAAPAARRGRARRAAPPGWRETYQQQYQLACHDCFQPCTRTTLGFAPLVVRLCQACARGYESPAPRQRLVAKTHARQRFCLWDADLAGLPHAVESNPANPAFLPMHLYRRTDAHAAAVARHGSSEAVEREYHCRLVRR